AKRAKIIREQQWAREQEQKKQLDIQLSKAFGIEIVEPDCKYLSEYIGTRKDYDMKSYATRILNGIKKLE
ncbi:MAG: hypothetical protein WCO98_04270, partial [bacterium]